jgi:mRNA interferase MazF
MYPLKINGTRINGNGKNGQIVLDQIRTINKIRLIKRLGKIDKNTAQKVLEILGEMFAP